MEWYNDKRCGRECPIGGTYAVWNGKLQLYNRAIVNGHNDDYFTDVLRVLNKSVIFSSFKRREYDKYSIRKELGKPTYSSLIGVCCKIPIHN